MPTLNRFPLLGLWAREAALRLGYNSEDAQSLGHAYAVLYAIRAQSVPRPKYPRGDATATSDPIPAATPDDPDLIDLGGDELEVRYTPAGRIHGIVGRAQPQTPRTYEVSVQRKFPGDYHHRLERAFEEVWNTIEPRQILSGRLIYKLYDQWKKSCAAGRMVDLDKLLKWCEERTANP